MPRQYVRVGVVVVLFATSCAARGPSPALVAEAGVADAAFREGCYRCLEHALATFERLGKYAESVKARRIAAAEKRVETSEHRKAQAAFNAAQCFVRFGQKSSALNHVDVAAQHVQLREKATTLRITIDRMPR